MHGQHSPRSQQHHLAIKITFILKYHLQMHARSVVSFTGRCKSLAERKKAAVFHAVCVQVQDSQRPQTTALMRAKTHKNSGKENRGRSPELMIGQGLMRATAAAGGYTPHAPLRGQSRSGSAGYGHMESLHHLLHIPIQQRPGILPEHADASGMTEQQQAHAVGKQGGGLGQCVVG